MQRFVSLMASIVEELLKGSRNCVSIYSEKVVKRLTRRVHLTFSKSDIKSLSMYASLIVRSLVDLGCIRIGGKRLSVVCCRDSEAVKLAENGSLSSLVIGRLFANTQTVSTTYAVPGALYVHMTGLQARFIETLASLSGKNITDVVVDIADSLIEHMERGSDFAQLLASRLGHVAVQRATELVYDAVKNGPVDENRRIVAVPLHASVRDRLSVTVFSLLPSDEEATRAVVSMAMALLVTKVHNGEAGNQELHSH